MHWTEQVLLQKHMPKLPPREPRDFGDNDAADPEQNLEEKD